MIDFCIIFSVICEILALLLALYFKNTRIFFLSLCLIEVRFFYLYTTIFQAHLFNSLFLPLIFCFLCLRKDTKIIRYKKNITVVLALLFMGVLGVFLPQNIDFNDSVLSFHFMSFFKPMSELGLVFFIFMALLLALKVLKTREFYLFFAFFGMYFEFFFENTLAFFEWASFVFAFYLLYGVYKNAFFDSLTLLPNGKNLSRFVRAKEFYIIALLHFNELETVQETYSRVILKKIAKILRRFKTKIFIVDLDFILIFEDENTALKHLAYLESLLKNTEFELEREKFKLDFKLLWQENEQSLEQSLINLRKKLTQV